MLGTTLRHAIASELPVIVVTTEALSELAKRTVAARDVIIVPEAGAPGHPEAGMGYSIACGVTARANAAGWVILPGDMPLVQPSSLIAVARELNQHPVVCAQYKGRRGHPVGFGAELYSELALLTGDDGAAAWWRATRRWAWSWTTRGCWWMWTPKATSTSCARR